MFHKMYLIHLFNVKRCDDLLASYEDKKIAKDYIERHLNSSLTIRSRCLKRCSHFTSRLEHRMIKQSDERIFRKLLEEVMIEKGLIISLITGKNAPIYILESA